ncbi:vasodilator stimulated phosphoprotein a [Sinocyclocheilus rhinocerous]|uniref:vasodilator stimulated phosphoprotein a n=1 Tax=Sinocyclocheilus rhinocerous TaxID=307959 RepID=UPI0007B95886|nr:PREDICTED: vasodilator-stimulated phosphoprotein-like [Sinocyclocheilus rhinocerous]
MSEQSICQARATVMMYDDGSKRWLPAGSGAQAISRVHIFQNPSNNSFRVVGRKQQADQQVVINCPLVRGIKYNQATPTFHQWRDARQVWGLNFGSKEDAAQFASGMTHALDVLSGDAGACPPPPRPPPNGPSAEEIEQKRRQEQQERERQERERQVSAAPAPPPGPPPAPDIILNIQLSVSADIILDIQLSVSADIILDNRLSEDSGAAAPAVSASTGGGGGGGGLMGEMSAIFARRRKVADTPAVKTEETSSVSLSEDSGAAAPAVSASTGGGGGGGGLMGEMSAILARRVNSASKSQDKSPVSPATAAPLSRTRPGSSTGDAADMEKLKQDILEEMRKELQKVKDEIISALLEELQKINAA